jgi:release factor glutamine methyltransferase
MTISQALSEAENLLRVHQVENPTRCAGWLLETVLACSHTFLLAHSLDELTSEQDRLFFELVRRRGLGEPLQYLLGHEEFHGLDFEVTPDVLIPRPETELLVDEALTRMDSVNPVIVDVGTGSGCIAISIARACPQARLIATDLSSKALQVARRNARRLEASGVLFLEGDLLSPLSQCLVPGEVDAILANPPYIADGDLEQLQREVRDWEPHLALTAGTHGTAVFERLIPQALAWLRPGGWFLAEIGYDIKGKVLALFGIEWEVYPVKVDLNGIPRVVIAQKKSDSGD